MSASRDAESPTWCAVCGVPGLEGARFCGHCGSRLHRRCTGCLALVAPELSFCPMCGTSAGGGDVPVRLPLAREERRTVTILFADLIGFTSLGERLDPEDLRRAQQDYFGVVRRIVESYGGVVEKYIGDAVMAVFGAPVAHENDPFRAVRAALELPKVLAGRSVGGQPLRVRLGVATGEAVVDLAAVGDRGQALVAGDVVNVAARLQAAAPAGGVLVTAATQRATRGTIDYAQHDRVTLAGKAEPVEVWLAQGASATRVAAEHDDDTALAGRDSELQVLEATLRRSLVERRTQLVSLVGAPGLGKSRLVRELRSRADADPAAWATWLTGRCLPYGEGVTYWALGEIVKAAAGILDSDDADTARDRLDAFLGGLVGSGEARALQPALAPLVGLPTGALSAEEAHAGWRRVLLRLAEQAPLVLVVEDLHWADESLLRFLESLVAAADALPLLVLATMRPELLQRATGWAGGQRNSTTIELGPLPDAPMAALFGDLLGRRAFPADTLSRLVSLAGGNPLYAEEYVRMLADSGVLRRDGGHGLEIAAADVPMPDSVQGVIASRLDLLGPAEQAVLAAASVVGETVWTGAVAATGGLAQPTTEQGLTDLSRRDFLRARAESSVAGEAEWSFRHILVRDIAYARLPRGQRVDLHRQCADWLESLPASRGEDLAELRAHHRDSAFQLARTLGLNLEPFARPARLALVTAAVRAQRLHAVDAAAGLVARALADWPAEEDRPERLRAELLQAELAAVTSVQTFVEGGGPERLRGLAARGLALGERVPAARAWTLLAQVELMRTDRRGALDALHEALGLFAGEPDSEDKAATYATLARLHMVAGETTPAIAAADRARSLAHALGLLEIEANALVTAGAARFIAGDAAGLDEMEHALDMCRRHGLRALGRACINLATAMQELGDMRRCYELIDEAATVAASAGLSMVTRFSDDAMRATFAGDWDATLAAADEFLRDAAAGTADWDVQVVAMCAWLQVLRGEDPGDRVEQALEVARQTGFHDLLCAALAHGALCRALQDRRADALALLDELHEVRVRHDAGPSREWAAAAVAAATLTGPDRLAPLAAWLEEYPRRTPWVEAATASARAGLAEHAGDLRAAAAHHLDAAARYDAIGNATDAALGRAEAARLLLAVGDDEAARAPLESTVDFARRNSAWRLVPAAHRPDADDQALGA